MRYIGGSKVSLLSSKIHTEKVFVVSVGVATFFFGFAAPAALNAYWLLTNFSFVHQFRSSLSYTSAIFGDGIILPIVNMLIASFLLQHQKAARESKGTALGLGIAITLFFHVNQAVNGIVNWAMPTPWHWNFLGVWHAAYMLAVASFISLFYLVTVPYSKKEHCLPKELFLVTFGIVLFFVLLRLDYRAVDLRHLFPRVL
jgi:hypothetical protein